MFVKREIYFLYYKASNSLPTNATLSKENLRNVPINLSNETTNLILPKDSSLSETNARCLRLLSYRRAEDLRL